MDSAKNNEYNSQRLIDQYYQMQFCPLLKGDKNTCLTESYYQTIFAISRPYLNSSTKLLDIGCGLGRVVFDVAKEQIQKAIGIDTSEAFIAECNKIVRNQSSQIHLSPSLSPTSFQVADAQDLPFSSHEFNFVVCLNVIDRIPEPKKLAKEIERVLESGGILLIADPYDWQEEYTHPSEQVKNMLNLFDKSLWTIQAEIDKLPFTLQVNERKTVSYSSHLLLLRRA